MTIYLRVERPSLVYQPYEKNITIRICGLKYQAQHSISVNDILKDAVMLFGIRNETVFDKNFWDFLKAYRSFETSKSILLQVAREISGDPYASEILKAVFWRMKANFGDFKNERDNADANRRFQAEHQQVLELQQLQQLQHQRSDQLERYIEEERRMAEYRVQQIAELHQRNDELHRHLNWEYHQTGELKQHLEVQQQRRLQLECSESIDDIESEFYILDFTAMVNERHHSAILRCTTGWQTYSAPLFEPGKQQQLLYLFGSKLPKIAKIHMMLLGVSGDIDSWLPELLSKALTNFLSQRQKKPAKS